MKPDTTTIHDLNIFGRGEEGSFFAQLDLTSTKNGSLHFEFLLRHPYSNLQSILETQQAIQRLSQVKDNWPSLISNGTIKVIESFYESSFQSISYSSSSLQILFYRILQPGDYSLLKYSVEHAFDFIKGMRMLIDLLQEDSNPENLKKILEEAQQLMNRNEFSMIRNHTKIDDIAVADQMKLGSYFRYQYKHQMNRLLEIHAKLDAWLGMALATERFGLTFPEFTEDSGPELEIKGLYHLLLSDPVPYDVTLDANHNFLFLTGANMAGKSTFIKSVGTAVYLAHCGLGVPASSMKLCLFEGIISNINIMDNLTKGESYFFNEVQRIKATLQKISNGQRCLVLIDELFKGTNIEDAMKCSGAVIDGLVKIPQSVFILSTHLYEISETLTIHSNIRFKFFETRMINGEFSFSYRLQDGVCRDRLGYLILKKEGVVDMLDQLKQELP